MTKPTLDNIKIGKLLGHGMFGMTYLATLNNKKYAVKISHVLPKYVQNTKEKRLVYDSLYREIAFQKFLKKQELPFFTPILDYGWFDDDSCNFEQKYSAPHQVDEKMNHYHKQLATSPFCTKRLYPYIETTLDQIFHKLKKRDFYELILCLSIAISTMNQAGFRHNDLNFSNIGITKNINMTIKHNEFRFKPKYIPVLLDYDELSHDKWNNTTWQKRQFETPELVSLIPLFYSRDFWNNVWNMKITFDKDQWIARLNETNESIIAKSITDVPIAQVELMALLSPEIYQQIIIGSTPVPKKFNFDRTIDLADSLYFIASLHDSDKIVDHFVNIVKNFT